MTKEKWSSKYDTKPRLQLLTGSALSFSKERFNTTAELLTNISPPRVKVVFNHQSMQKIRALCESCEIEIGALGLVDVKIADDGTRIYKVYDIFVPEQECSPTVTKLTPNGLFNLFHELDARYGLKKAKAIKDKLAYWWHSHVFFGTGPSPRDETTFTEQSSGRQMYFMSIGNKNGDLHVNAKLKVPEMADWAQWEIRDITWQKDWETVVAVKEEVHPLLLEEGDSNYHIRTFTDSGAGEIVRDPEIYTWAKEQVHTKVKGGASFFNRDHATLVLPDELADVKVEEFQINETQDLGSFVLELFGEKPPKPIPPAPPVTKPVVTEKNDSPVVTDGAVTEVVTEKVIPTTPLPVEVDELKNDWVLDFTKMRKWWPKQLTFSHLDNTMNEVNAVGKFFITIWMIIVVLVVRPIGWLIFTFAFKIIKLLVFDWYAVPLRALGRWFVRLDERAEKRGKERDERDRQNRRKVGTRITPKVRRSDSKETELTGEE